MKTVLTFGVFDLLHIGHVELFRKAKELGDILMVAVQDGDSVLKYKPGKPPVLSTVDRLYLVKAIRYVDSVAIYNDVDEFVRQVPFDILVTGPDQVHKGFERAIRWCREHGKETVVLPRTEGISTSLIKDIIRQK